ncbi:MAG TPA: hypothetical protein DCX53_15785, partial [Anaerolineae bacterium]|nr:hypothetical protein [Anaerolineae bacterium]
PRGLERVLSLAGYTSYQCRESGPYPHGMKSWMRTLLWRMLRGGLRLYDLIESGGENYGVYTRVFVASVLKGAV